MDVDTIVQSIYLKKEVMEREKKQKALDESRRLQEFLAPLKQQILSNIECWLNGCQITGSDDPLSFTSTVDSKELAQSASREFEIVHLLSEIQQTLVGQQYMVKLDRLGTARDNSVLTFTLFARILPVEVGLELCN